MFGTSWRVSRIAGIEVRIDSSWVVVALLITYSMYLRLSVLYRELSGGGAVGLAILSAVLFFGSVLVHELAHALVAQVRGIRVQDITLFLFGGATRGLADHALEVSGDATPRHRRRSGLSGLPHAT